MNPALEFHLFCEQEDMQLQIKTYTVYTTLLTVVVVLNAPRPSEHPPVWGKKCQNVVVVSHIQRIGCQPEKTTLHGGQSCSWFAGQGGKKKKEGVGLNFDYDHPLTFLSRNTSDFISLLRRIALKRPRNHETNRGEPRGNQRKEVCSRNETKSEDCIT